MSSAVSQQQQKHSPATGIGSLQQSETSPARGNSSSEDPLPNAFKRTSLLLNELKCLSAQQQALQQQALHQAALHLKHHNDLPQLFSQQQPQSSNINTLSSAQLECMEAEMLCASPALLQGSFANESEHVRGGASVGRVLNDDPDSQSHPSLLALPQVGVADFRLPTSVIAPPVNDSTACSSLISEDQTQRLEKKDLSSQKDGLDGCKNLLRSGNSKPKLKGPESGVDGEMDLQFTGTLATTREENVKGLKAGLIHVAHKMPKNAHAHFVLGLMYQRLEQFAKAASAFQKADEILKKAEEELGQHRAQLLGIVQCHYAVSMLQAKVAGGKVCSGNELQSSEIESWVKDLKLAVQTDPCLLLVWNTLGLVLLQTGQTQSAISILRLLLHAVPNSLDALSNLAVAYLQSGHLADAARCLQLLLGKDNSHPGALSNYGTLLLCQHGSFPAGAGAGIANAPEKVAVITAQKCFTATLMSNPKAGHLWASLAAAYSMLNESFSAAKCLQLASKLEPTRLSTRYAVAMQRVRESQFSFAAAEQLSWAANEMVSILRVGDSATIQPHIAWVGLATVNKMQHEMVAAFEGDKADLREMEARAFHTLQQAVEQNPHDPIQWQQLGLYMLCTLQFRIAQRFFKIAIAQRQTCGAIWSNLGISLQLSDELALAEEVYKRALSLVPGDKAHSILSNLGNLYRQQGHFADARVAFRQALEICPNYAPACNNLGLLLVVEGKFDEAIKMFDCALLSDSLLDAAKSNKMKAQALARLHDGKARAKLGSNDVPCASKYSSYECIQMCNS